MLHVLLHGMLLHNKVYVTHMVHCATVWPCSCIGSNQQRVLSTISVSKAMVKFYTSGMIGFLLEQL